MATTAERLAEVQAAISERVTGAKVEEYKIMEGQSYRHARNMTLRELMELESLLQRQLKKENLAGKGYLAVVR